MSGPGSVVDIATGYGLDGSGIESWWGRDFPHLSRRGLGPPSLPYNGYWVFPGGKERPGRDTDPSTPLWCGGHERVELYLYSSYGLYGLYSASVPVQGCTLPYFIYIYIYITLYIYIYIYIYIYTRVYKTLTRKASTNKSDIKQLKLYRLV